MEKISTGLFSNVWKDESGNWKSNIVGMKNPEMLITRNYYLENIKLSNQLKEIK